VEKTSSVILHLQRIKKAVKDLKTKLANAKQDQKLAVEKALTDAGKDKCHDHKVEKKSSVILHLQRIKKAVKDLKNKLANAKLYHKLAIEKALSNQKNITNSTCEAELTKVQNCKEQEIREVEEKAAEILNKVLAACKRDQKLALSKAKDEHF